MKKPLDELYLGWLYQQVANPEIVNPSQTYWNLLQHLLGKEYVWIIPNDDNRVEDGRDLRYEFIEDLGLDNVALDWINLGCSMLEMLIALSRRLSFQDGGEPRDWFWRMIDNLGLNIVDQQKFPRSRVEEVLDRQIWRTYRSNGAGGLFPLKHPRRDQRDIELWVQLNAFLLENE